MGPGTGRHVLLFDAAAGRAAAVTERLMARGFTTSRFDVNRPSSEPVARGAEVAIVVVEDGESCDSSRVSFLVDKLRAKNVATLIWGLHDEDRGNDGGSIDWMDPETSIDEVIGRLTTLARYAPQVKRLDRELNHLQRLGDQLRRHFEDIDHELRLAGRLQQDFLPAELPSIAPLRFARLFRPAAWVSGDIYDVFRIDDHTFGMFIADAMGHGTAAGLLTMYVRRALAPTRLGLNGIAIVPPSEALCGVHTELARQELPHSQFITGMYAVIDTRTLDVRLARGGHPYAVRVSSDGVLSEVVSEGSLLGIPAITPEFNEATIRLTPGEKLIFYTDGLEDVIIADRDDQTEEARFTERFSEWARMDSDSFVQALGGYLDHREGSLNPEDDVTVLVAEVERS